LRGLGKLLAGLIPRHAVIIGILLLLREEWNGESIAVKLLPEVEQAPTVIV